MSIISKIKSSVESATGYTLHYYDEGTINEILDSNPLPCAFWYLLKDAEIITDASQNKERANIAIFFVNKTEFDFNSTDNETIIEAVKTKANIWLRSLMQDGALKISEGTQIKTTRVYNEFDAILTGVAFNLTIEEAYGFNACTDTEYEPTNVRRITHNGVFDVHNYYWVEVDILYKWGEIEGDINEQTDLINLINTRPTIDDTTTSTTKVWSSSKVSTELAGKVDKETGKGLSSNDYTTEEKNKLAGIEAGAEVNPTYEVETIEPTTTNFAEGEEYEVESAFQRTANLFAGQRGLIDTINSKIPNQATSTNQLADKAFVNATIQTNTANFRGEWATWSVVPSQASGYPKDYTGSKTPTNNDYLVVQDASDFTGLGDDFKIAVNRIQGTDTYHIIITGAFEFHYVWNKNSGNVLSLGSVATINTIGWSVYVTFNVAWYNEELQAKTAGTSETINADTLTQVSRTFYEANTEAHDGQWRFIYVGAWSTYGKLGWHAQYRVGQAFTQAQQSAIDSGITSSKVSTYDGYGQSITDLNTNKVDKVNLASKIYGTDAGGLQTTYDKSGFQPTLVSGTNIKTINSTSLLGSGDIEVGGSAFPKIIMPSSTTTATLQPNTFYEWGEMASLNLTLANEVSGIENKYIFRFESGDVATSLTLPASVKWSEGITPTIKTTSKYIISIQLNIAKVEREYQTPSYITNGLVLHLDGIEYGGLDGKWIDKVSERVFTAYGGASRIENGFSFVQVGDYLTCPDQLTGIGVNVATVEACAKYTDNYGCIFSNNIAGNILLFSDTNNNFTLGNSASGNTIRYSRRSVTDVKITASFTTSNGIMNYNSLTSITSDYLTASGNVISIGTALSNDHQRTDSQFKGEIYAIRVYNRKLSQAEMLVNQRVDNTRFNLGL